jgi:KaiC/GvpD/RAD55 family RecA-like ATPase
MIKINPKDKILLAQIQEEKYAQHRINIVKGLQKNKGIIYVTFKESHIEIIKNFAKNGIKTERIFFIDTSGRTSVESINSFIISTPYALTKTKLAIQKALDYYIAHEQKTAEVILIFDSLSGLLNYVSEYELESFLRSIIQLYEMTGVQSILLILGKNNDKIAKKFKNMFDRIIKI